MSGIVGSKINVKGSGVVDKLGTDGQALTSAGAGLPLGFETAGGGMWSKIKFQEVTAGGASLEFINGTSGVTFDSTYTYYMLQFRNYVGSVADRKMALEISTDTGGSWKTSGYECCSWQSGFDDAKRLAYDYSLLATQEMGIVAGEGAFGFIMLQNPAQAAMPSSLYVITQGQNSQDPQGYSYVGAGVYTTAGAYDGVRFTTSGGSGEITTLQATLYGHTD